MLHLPALAVESSIGSLASTVSKLGLTLRGTYGEGSEATGDIYQLSNQVTLGISEEGAIQNLLSITKQIIAQERHAREALLKNDAFIDKIFRAYGILKSAHMISCAEFTALSSLVRIGAAAGLLDVKLETLTELLVEMQPATINAALGKAFTSSKRDVIRAEEIKKALS